jgi:general secretion pathway protein A
MYETFFGFKEKPFNITPDPKYLYLSEQHEEAIAHLLYGIHERGGFVVITGEIGTGKTTLCRHLINQMDERTEGAIIFNPNLSEIELLKSINEDFGIASTGETKKELIDELNRFLLEERLRGKNMVLIIDEAQNLLPEVLEQVRMLSNLETEKEKLIQIVLIGQPQLRNLLARPELQQLDQRVTARYHLKQLSRKETFKYIQHRLAIASNGNNVRFERSAMRSIYKFSRGTPRLINVVCDRALLGAFTAGSQSPIPKKIVKQAIREVTGPKPRFTERLSLDSTAVTLFVLPFLLMLTLVAGWAVLNVIDGFRATPGFLGSAEMIPDQVHRTLREAVPDEQRAQPEPARAVGQTAAPAATSEKAAPSSNAPESETGTPRKRLMDLLLSESYENSRLTAARNLLSLWGKRLRPTANSSESFYMLALSGRMRCTELWTNLDGLRRYNSPCLLEMFIPQQVKPRYAVLVELGPDSATILYGNASRMELSLDLLDKFWLRRAFIFWNDFEDLREIIKSGDRGGSVVWLQGALQTLGFYSGELSGYFDPATERAVRDFQREHYLMLDGIVGPRTRLALYGNLKRYPMPRLNSGKT